MEFGSELIKKNFVSYESKHAACMGLAEETALTGKDIARLRKLPNIAAEGLGYLSQRAIRECTQPEYTELVRTILMLEAANSTNEEVSHLEEQVNSIRKLMFSAVDLNVEIGYFELPNSLRSELESIDSLNKPFNLLDAYQRAWN
ncbi:hypothetical protein VB10N_23390 [Vibrio sp. 10N]|nr:hypothetical protein VB10N_23390 [Vibrio sp. 10N]